MSEVVLVVKVNGKSAQPLVGGNFSENEGDSRLTDTALIVPECNNHVYLSLVLIMVWSKKNKKLSCPSMSDNSP